MCHIPEVWLPEQSLAEFRWTNSINVSFQIGHTSSSFGLFNETWRNKPIIKYAVVRRGATDRQTDRQSERRIYSSGTNGYFTRLTAIYNRPLALSFFFPFLILIFSSAYIPLFFFRRCLFRVPTVALCDYGASATLANRLLV